MSVLDPQPCPSCGLFEPHHLTSCVFAPQLLMARMEGSRDEKVRTLRLLDEELARLARQKSKTPAGWADSRAHYDTLMSSLKSFRKRLEE